MVFFLAWQNCWTPRLVSTKCNAVDIVYKLIEKKPNVNAHDKDGCTALMIACKEGYYDISSALLSACAYFNVQVSHSQLMIMMMKMEQN